MENNPYSPPNLAEDPASPQPESSLPLATLGQRFAASLLDSLVIFGPLLAFAVFAPIAPLNQLVEDDSALSNAAFSLIGFFLFVALNFYLINTRDQTIGKAALKIKVVELNGQSPSTNKQLSIRYSFFYLIGIIPIVGSIISLVNILFIFGKERRCLHDQMAGTQVIQIRQLG